MPPRRWEDRLRDVLDAIHRIEEFTHAVSREQFELDQKLRSAVLYQFIIIGEAANHIPVWLTEKYPALPWSQMRAFRNILAHVYFDVELKIVWETVRHDLPPLIPQLQAILAAEK